MSATEERICGFIQYEPMEALKICAEAEVTVDDFSDPVCQTYYKAARGLLNQHKVLFAELIAEHVFEKSLLTPSELARVTPTHPGMISYEMRPLCFILRKERKAVAMNEGLQRLAAASKDKNSEAIKESLAQINAAGHEIDLRRALTWEQSLSIEIANAEATISGKEPDDLRTIAWPWPSVGERHGDYRRGELCVVAGSPSLGKSSFKRQVLLSSATRGLSCLMVSLEVKQGDVQNLLAAGISGQSWSRLKGLHPKDQKDFMNALRSLKSLPIKIVDGLTSLDSILSAIHKANEENFLDVIAIDYLGLIEDCEQTRTGTKASNTGKVTAAFKRLATELNCLVLLGVQLNRDQMRDGNREPKLIDLKDSGDIEAHADRVLLLHRPNEDPFTHQQQKTHEDVETQPRFFQQIFQEKGRNVGTTYSSMYFRRECARFDLIAR